MIECPWNLHLERLKRAVERRRKNGAEPGIVDILFKNNVIVLADHGAAFKSCIKSVIFREIIKSSLYLCMWSILLRLYIDKKLSQTSTFTNSGTWREEKATKVINLQDTHNSQRSVPWGRIILQWWDLPCYLLKLLLWEFLKVRGNGLKTWKFKHSQNTMLGHFQIKFSET